jgi:hypothetical protein
VLLRVILSHRPPLLGKTEFFFNRSGQRHHRVEIVGRRLNSDRVFLPVTWNCYPSKKPRKNKRSTKWAELEEKDEVLSISG